MNIEKEREAFENWFRTTEMYICLIEYISSHQTSIKSVFIKNGNSYENTMVDTSWYSWVASKQHEAKKLKGFVVMPVEPTDLMINAYRDNSVAPISTLSIAGYKAMVEAARGGK
ncbi:hypothetical protein PY247_10395 [Acinetobacter proteolyticus]|nr:hypothetical protein [Acinetobacter proteolyticus]WEI20084.1 hypothetical protein PY247_10395 [Acinetobacter proteolyticus]